MKIRVNAAMARASGMFLKSIKRAGLLFLVLAWLALPQAVYAEDALQDSRFREQILNGQLKNEEVRNVRDAVDRALKDIKELDYDFSVDRILEDAAKGMPMNRLNGLPSALLGLLGKEFRANVLLMLELFAVMLLAAVLKGLQPKEGGLSGEAVKLAVNGALAVMAAASFGSIVRLAQGTIESMQILASVAMPSMYAMMAASGQVVSATALQPLVLAGVNTTCHLFRNIFLPLTVMAGVLFLVDSISDRFKLKNLAKLLKTIAVWATGAITLIFSIAVNIQKISGSAVDAAAVKTAKFAIGTLVPVAGKNMSDAAETILACTQAVRNAAGVVTVIGLGILFAVPFIKMVVIMLVYRLIAAFGAPLSDEGICGALEDAAGCMSVMIGIMGASLFVLILLTGTLMSSTGFA